MAKKPPKSYYYDKFVDPRTVKQIKVRWSKETWEYHLGRHPELLSRANASNLIKLTIEDPCLVMEGEVITSDGKENKICYYRSEKQESGFVEYTKVVVGCNSDPFYIKSVWKQWASYSSAVKEKNYPQFKEIWKKEDCPL